MDYKFTNNSHTKYSNEDGYSRPYNNSYNRDSDSNPSYSGPKKRFNNHENKFEKGEGNDHSGYSQQGQGQGYRNYRDQGGYNNYNSNNSYNNSYKNYDNSEDSTNSYQKQGGSKNGSTEGSAWNSRYNRKNMNWKYLWEEEEKMFSEHLEHSSKKETFDIAFLENTKLNVYLNNREVIAENTSKTFSELKLDPRLKSNLDKIGFDVMTPIQKAVIPYIIEKKDVMGCAQTGSGKTVSFLAPMINTLLQDGPPKSDVNLPYGVSAPVALILTPTRELCEQIYKEGRKLLHKTGILVVKVYGGVPIDTQIRNVTNGCDILVATPGRLIDFIKRGLINLAAVKFLVFDEADRMLDMGFEDQLRDIIFQSDINAKDQRINMMFSATFTTPVREIAKSFMNEFYFVTSNLDQDNKANENIEQNLICVDEKEKVLKLHEILQQIKGSVIIFLDTKRGVDNLTYFLNQRNYNTIAIHGDKTQDRRQNAINAFSKGEVPILIATDVASRGIDFPNVPYVFNFDLPSNIDDYIHRIGRTGRCGNKGTAYSFVSENCRITRDLYKLLLKSKQVIPDWFENLSKRSSDSSGGNYHNKKSYRGGYSNNYGGGFNSSYNSNTRENFNTHSSGGFNQSRGKPTQTSNYVSVPADYFKKGENFRRDPEAAPRMNTYNNFNNTPSTSTGFNSNTEQRNTFTRGYQK